MTQTALLVAGFLYFSLVFGQILGRAFRSSEAIRDEEVLAACMARGPEWRKR